MFRGKTGLETKQLLPPEYIPIYRHWDWYARASEGGTGVTLTSTKAAERSRW